MSDIQDRMNGQELIEYDSIEQRDYRYDDYIVGDNRGLPDLSMEEVGDIHDPRFIYVGSPGDDIPDEILEEDERVIPESDIISRRRRAETIKSPESDQSFSNPWRVNIPISNMAQYSRKITRTKNYRGNVAKDSPIDAKIRSSVQIPVFDDDEEDIPEIDQNVVVNIKPLEVLMKSSLRHLINKGSTVVPLPSIKSAINATNLAFVPSNVADRRYVTNLALTLIEQYIDPELLAQELDLILTFNSELEEELRERFPNIDQFIEQNLRRD